MLRIATARVAAPSVCFAVACILLAAAPTAPPCFRRWRRSSPLLLPRGGLGIPQSFASSPEAPLLGELAGASPTERLDGRRTARRSISLPVIEVINFHSTTFYHTFPLATRLNGQKTAKMGKKVEKMRRNHSAAAPQSHKTLGKKRQNLQKYHYSLDVV